MEPSVVHGVAVGVFVFGALAFADEIVNVLLAIRVIHLERDDD